MDVLPLQKRVGVRRLHAEGWAKKGFWIVIAQEFVKVLTIL